MRAVTSPPSDAELAARQAALQAEAGALLAAPDLAALLGLEVHTAVLEDGVRTPGQFAAWLDRRAPAGEP